MHTTLGPRLEQLGPVADPHVDFVRLAALVYLVDRTAPRSGRGFERELSLTVPVSYPDAWGGQAEGLAGLLRLLSSDSWSLTFTSARPPRRRQVADAHSSELVLLFSGGADSLSGTLIAHADERVPLLTSHWDFSITGGIQNRLVDELTTFWGAAPTTQKVRLGRRTSQIGSGIRFRKEGSSRSRSLLFLALGLAVASVNDAELWMAENGFASRNVPLTGERRAAFSTRTTHPGFLRDLSAVLRALGLRVRLSTRSRRSPRARSTSASATRSAPMRPPSCSAPRTPAPSPIAALASRQRRTAAPASAAWSATRIPGRRPARRDRLHRGAAAWPGGTRIARSSSPS